MPTRGPGEHPISARRLAGIVCLVVLAFVVQAGLAPLHFSTSSATGDSSAFFAAVWHDLIVPDIVSNVLLYIPVGLGVSWYLICRLRRTDSALWGALAVGTVVSVAIEYVQAYLPGRVSSAIDCSANVIGTALGCALALVVPRLVASGAHRLRASRWVVVAKLYALVLVLAATVPFTVTFDATQLFRSARDGYWIPFSSLAGSGSTGPAGSSADVFEIAARVGAIGSQEPRTPARRAGLIAKWYRYRLCARWLAEFASFAVLAWLVYAALRWDCGFARGAAVGLTVWVCGGLALLLSGLHLLVPTRLFDATDLLFRLMGIMFALGLIAQRKWRADERPDTVFDTDSWLVRRAPILVGGFILYLGLIPLSFEWTAERLARSVLSTSFLPLASYNAARFDVMLADLLEKLALWWLWALCLAQGGSRVGTGGLSRGMLMPVAAVSVGLAFVIETFQLFSPVRTASLTDPALAWVGAWVGVASYRQLSLLLDRERSRGVVQPETVKCPRGLSLSDGLIASLADEHEEAPREPAVRPRVPLTD